MALWVIFFFTLLSKKSRVIFTEKSLAWLKNFFVFSSRQTFSFFNNNSAVCEIITREITGFYLVIFRFLLVVVVKSREIVNFSWNHPWNHSFEAVGGKELLWLINSKLMPSRLALVIDKVSSFFHKSSRSRSRFLSL